MITLEDKLDTFYKIVYKAEEEKTKLALEELENTQKLLLEKKIEELENKKEKTLNKIESQAVSEKNEMISESIDRNRRLSLVKREELLENLIQALELRAINFSKTDKYIDFIIRKIKETLTDIEEDNLILGLKSSDREKIEKSIEAISAHTSKIIKLKDSNDISLGGFKIWDKDRNYTLDNTFKTIIEESRYEIGKKLYIALDRAGGKDE